MTPSATDSTVSFPSGSSPRVLTPGREHLLAAIADPVRLAILSLLRQPMAVTEVCRRLDMAQPRISHHLGVLRRCGLVVARSEGRRRLHRWADGPIHSDVAAIQELLRRWLEESPSAAPERSRAAAAGGSSAKAADFEDYLL